MKSWPFDANEREKKRKVKKKRGRGRTTRRYFKLARQSKRHDLPLERVQLALSLGRTARFERWISVRYLSKCTTFKTTLLPFYYFLLSNFVDLGRSCRVPKQMGIRRRDRCFDHSLTLRFVIFLYLFLYIVNMCTRRLTFYDVPWYIGKYISSDY